jgi:hypothetical protein
MQRRVGVLHDLDNGISRFGKKSDTDIRGEMYFVFINTERSVE